MLMNRISPVVEAAKTEAQQTHEKALSVAQVEQREHSLVGSRNAWKIAGTNGNRIVWGYVKCAC